MAQLTYQLWDRQCEAFETEATELLFGGASRGGKSHFIRIALIAWCMGIPQLQCKLIRKKFDDILENHLNGPGGFKDLLAPLEKTGQVKVTQDGCSFANGSQIIFKHCQDERQFTTAQGNQTHVLVLDEATQIGERLIRFFRGWVTMSEEMKASLPDWAKGKFPRIVYTANPIGVSVSFFRRHFVDARPPFKIEKAGAFLRQYIPSRVEDNPSENAEAAKERLMDIGDEAIAHALIEGDWSAPTGDYFPEWNEERHVVKDFSPPSHWFRYRTYDWGTAEPSYCAYWAVSDGEPFRDSEGNQRWFPRGAIILYNEWYIADPRDPSKGLRMRNGDMARGILDRSELNAQQVVTLTDSKPFQDTGGDGPATEFMREGVILSMADTSRVAGWSQMRGRLIGIEWDSNTDVRLPMLYVCAQCKAARDYIPALPRHPSEAKKEDAAEHGEPTHVCDAIRYACMAHNSSVIKDRLTPMQARIQKEIIGRKPTMKSIMANMGSGLS